MEIFSVKQQNFDLAHWEQNNSKKAERQDTSFFEGVSRNQNDDKQFVLLQLSSEGNRVLTTSEINPILKGGEEKPDINMLLDFEGFNISTDENVDKGSKATLQLRVGQEKSMDQLDKLFYCVNGGLDLYNQNKNKKSDSRDFKKSTDHALGKKPISLPQGIGEVSLQVVKHQEPKWWKRVFDFASSNGAKDLFSMVGFGGITHSAVSYVGQIMDGLFDEEPDILFQSQPIKLGFSQTAKDELTGGLSTNLASCLNPGFWVMARKSDYDLIIRQKPIYYGGFGILAPDGMSEIDALKDSSNNPFSKITYAIIRSKIKEVDLKQGLIS